MSEMTQAAPSAVLRADAVHRAYRQGKDVVEVIRGVTFELARGDQCAIVGASGSGKSTLLHLLAGLDTPDQGKVWVDGKEMYALGDAARGRLRNRSMGFVYQFHHLLPEFSALENVAMPLVIRRTPKAECLERATDLLTRVGLGHRLRHKPGELSGGERQRTAIARALVTEPAVLLADEPTGNLDSKTAGLIHELMLEVNGEKGAALLVVTHNEGLAGMMGRVLHMRDGMLGE